MQPESWPACLPAYEHIQLLDRQLLLCLEKANNCRSQIRITSHSGWADDPISRGGVALLAIRQLAQLSWIFANYPSRYFRVHYYPDCADFIFVHLACMILWFWHPSEIRSRLLVRMKRRKYFARIQLNKLLTQTLCVCDLLVVDLKERDPQKTSSPSTAWIVLLFFLGRPRRFGSVWMKEKLIR